MAYVPKPLPSSFTSEPSLPSLLLLILWWSNLDIVLQLMPNWNQAEWCHHLWYLAYCPFINTTENCACFSWHSFILLVPMKHKICKNPQIHLSKCYYYYQLSPFCICAFLLFCSTLHLALLTFIYFPVLQFIKFPLDFIPSSKVFIISPSFVSSADLIITLYPCILRFQKNYCRAPILIPASLTLIH